MYSSDQSWIFSIITPVFSDPSKTILICWFAAQESFLIIINVENNCGGKIFGGNFDTFFVLILLLFF